MSGKAFTLMMLWLLVAPGVLHAGPVQLPQTGQQTCWNADGEIACSGTGQDGDLKKGAAWPIPRFTDNGLTITDNLTSLMWTKDANAPGPPASCETGIAKTWQGALNHVRCLNDESYLGYHDWRLPNVNELESLVNYEVPDRILSVAEWLKAGGQGFTNVQSWPYWSSSSVAGDPRLAWGINMFAGYLKPLEKLPVGGYVWPVRTYLGVVTAPPMPADGATGVSTRPILAWGPVTGAFSYDLYLWKEGEARPATPTIAGLSAGSIKIRTTLMVSSLYHWQVVARNSAGQSSGPEWSFTTRAYTLGDINGDNQVDLADALLSLQVLAGIRGDGVRSDYPASGTDVSGDGKIGLEETIYILQDVAEIR